MLFKSSHLYSNVKTAKCCKKCDIIFVVKRKDEQEVISMDRAEIAAEKHRKGYNCCQAVVCTFAEETGIDESLLYRMGEGFGAGMGTALGVCGAISGAAMLAGLVHSDGNTEQAGMTKANTTRAAGKMQKKFVKQAKALICKEIKTGNGGKAFTSCDDCIKIAVRLVEEELGL